MAIEGVSGERIETIETLQALAVVVGVKSSVWHYRESRGTFGLILCLVR